MFSKEIKIPRPEHPRPDFCRDNWMNLNGRWEFACHDTHFIDDDAQILNQPLSQSITVPFVYQSKLSGIHSESLHDCIWYRRHIEIPKTWRKKQILLHFGAVDYQAIIWWNKKPLGVHEGGHTPFTIEIPENLIENTNTIDVKVFDTSSLSQPRGKQSWSSPFYCWYTAVSGIWQTVWMEAVSEIHIDSLVTESDFDAGRVGFRLRPSGISRNLTLETTVKYKGQSVEKQSAPLTYPLTSVNCVLQDFKAWSPENPHLYDVRFRILSGDLIVDEITSYFGIRKIALDERGLILNNKPYFQKLILDQGYWPDGLYTAPCDEDYRRDIELAKAMGFNGCRKHMKVEDPRFLYWADRLGFLVWGEFPAFYEYTTEARERFMLEWTASVKRDRNHPSILLWLPFNESWGIRGVKENKEIQHWVKEVVSLTRFMDPFRLVIDNDGWEHVDSDIYGYHSYALPGAPLIADAEAYSGGRPALTNGKKLMADGIPEKDFPLMLTEFGGIAYTGLRAHNKAWGYEDIPPNQEAFIQRYEELFQTLQKLPRLCGWVYTQLTDVEQESNGLLYADRTPKFDVEWLLSVHSGSK